jgi:eukaryotic-like serine/threonine-protein kinase
VSDPRVGRVLADTWRLERLVGRGGMASVFAATHVRNGLEVAVKVLHPELTTNLALATRFRREGYAANRVEHPGVVRVLDDGVDGDHVFFVMDLLRGSSAKQLWEASGRRLPADEVVPLLDAVLDILVTAHDAGVVHRDVKPDNLFLCDDGRVRLLDFGIARVRLTAGHEEPGDVGEHLTQTGTMLGTPAFMSPEQALSHWEEVDATSDLFALAASAWLLLTGRLIHEARTVPELLVAAATRHAPPIRSVAPDLSPALAAVLDRALRHDKAERWPDARAMRTALEEARTAPHIVDAPAQEAADEPPPDPPTELPTGTLAASELPARTSSRVASLAFAVAGAAAALGAAGLYLALSPGAATLLDATSPESSFFARAERVPATAVAEPRVPPSTAPSQSAPLATHRAPAPSASAALGPFGRQEVQWKLDSLGTAAAATCAHKPGPRLVTVAVSFEPSGQSTGVRVGGVDPLSELGSCVWAIFSGVTCRPYQGGPEVVTVSVNLPP